MASPIRKETETYEDFRKRRSLENKALKRRLKGRLFWDSSRWGTLNMTEGKLP